MRKDRILLIADRMEKVKPSRYYQGAWAENVSSRTAEFKKVGDAFILIPKEDFCGSTACVLGHGAMVPGTGLRLWADANDVKIEGGRRFVGEVLVIAENDDGTIPDKTGQWNDGMDAAVTALEIPYEHAEIMFGCGGFQTRLFYCGLTLSQKHKLNTTGKLQDLVTPQMVAEALRKYVETDGASIQPAVDYWN